MGVWQSGPTWYNISTSHQVDDTRSQWVQAIFTSGPVGNQISLYSTDTF